MNYSTVLTILAIAVALGMVAMVPAIENQQANAQAHLIHHGCAFNSNGYIHSHGQCFHLG